MKYLFIIIFIISCSSERNRITEVEIYKVDFNIESFFQIRCDDFMPFWNVFKDKHLAKHLVIKGNELGILSNIISDMDTVNSDYYPDVRAKMIVYYEFRKDTICVGLFGFVMNGKTYKSDKRLLNYLESIK